MKKQFYFLFLLILTSFVLGCSKSDDGSTPKSEITDEHVDIVLSVVHSTELKYEELLNQEDITDEELRNALTEFLTEQEGVKSVDFDGEYTLEVTYDSGLYSYVLLEYIENLMDSEESVGTSYTNVVNNTKCSSNDLIETNSGLRTKSDSSFDINNTNNVCNNRVLILSAVEDQYTDIPTYTEDLKDVFINGNLEFTNNSGVAKNVEYVTNCNISSFKNITNYGTVILITHGQQCEKYGVVIMTNQTVKSSEDEDDEITTYLENESIVCYISPSGERRVGSNYWLTKSFIEKLPEKFPNSIIYCGACYSAADTTMSKAFLSKGAKAYIGYDNAIAYKKCITNATAFFNALIPTEGESYQTNVPTTTSQAYDLISDTYTWRQKQTFISFKTIEVTAQHHYNPEYINLNYSPTAQILGIDVSPTYVDLYLDTYLNSFKFNNVEVKYREEGNDVDLFTQYITITDNLRLNNLEANTEYKIIEVNIINGNTYYNNSIYYGNKIVSEDNPIIFTTLEEEEEEEEPESSTDGDRAILEKIYEATGGNNGCWMFHSNWCSDESLNQWEGVETNSEGRVVSLNFGYNNLTGELDLKGLDYLQTVDCYSNYSFIDPSSLTSIDASGCSNLIRIWCFSNKISYINFDGCVNLTEIDCRNNVLESIDVSECKSLETLWCSSDIDLLEIVYLPSYDVVTSSNGWGENSWTKYELPKYKAGWQYPEFIVK